MEYLLTQSNLKVLESFSFAKSLVAFDYDGTLAPIVSNPSLACMNESTEKLYRQLCSIRPVAIISGRSLSDMNKILKTKPKITNIFFLLDPHFYNHSLIMIF